MRLIDANVLINKLDEMISKAILADTEIHYSLIRELVAEQPTIEPEVRHGNWAKSASDELYCPYCSYVPQWNDDKYCANCGAQMDGGADNG